MNRASFAITLAVLATLPPIFAAEPTVTSGGIYSLELTPSATVPSTLSGGAFTLENGSFTPILTVETPDAPTLKIQHQGANIIVTWSAPIDLFQIEQTTSLGATWSALTATQQSAGAEIHVTVPISGISQFLRLKKAAQ